MADRFRFSGSYTLEPALGAPSGGVVSSAPVQEQETLTRKAQLTVDISDDNALAIALGDMSAGVNVIFIRATGGKLRARLTSTDGSQQAIPVDPLLFLISESVVATAIDLTRVAGSTTTVTVEIFLGQL